MKKKTLLRLSKGFTILLIVIFFVSFDSKAQFFDRLSNPQVSISLTHPPGFGIKVNKVAFGPATGTCSDQIVDA